MDQHHHRQKQKQFSSKSSLLRVVTLAIFTGVMIVTMPSAPVLIVFAANIDGTAGDDTLDGGNGDDEIYGGPGNDEVKDVNDVAIHFGNKVYGGPGDDNIDVGRALGDGVTYHIYGEAGSDYIDVISNEAYVNGGPDEDTIYCKADYGALYGNQGNDEIHIESSEISSAHALGGSGNDKLYSRGSEELQGNDGNDYLFA